MSTDFAINSASGALTLGSAVLAPLSEGHTVFTILAPLAPATRDMKTGWIWVDLREVVLHGTRCALSLALHNGVFREWSLVVTRSSWPSEDESLEDQQILARALGAALGLRVPWEVSSFHWGEAWCSFDRKSGYSSAGARFKMPNKAPEPTP